MSIFLHEEESEKDWLSLVIQSLVRQKYIMPTPEMINYASVAASVT